MNKEEIIKQAKEEFKDFCAVFLGKSLDEVDNIVQRNERFCFGSADPNTEEDMRDINYKHILATVCRINGKMRISEDVEYYPDDSSECILLELPVLAKRTIKIEVEIEYEYNVNHRALVGMDESYIDACAKDLAIQPNGNSIVDGVRLLTVCNREEDAWWLINNDK